MRTEISRSTREITKRFSTDATMRGDDSIYFSSLFSKRCLLSRFSESSMCVCDHCLVLGCSKGRV